MIKFKEQVNSLKNKLYNLNNEKKGIDTQNQKHKKIKPSLKEDNRVKSDYFSQANVYLQMQAKQMIFQETVRQ